jgi:hypothetical protein
MDAVIARIGPLDTFRGASIRERAP